ncbi:putative iron-sulfur cluster-binding metallochaperone [Nitrospira sp. Kam-Ns4a]
MDDCCRNHPPRPEPKEPKRCNSCMQPGKPVTHETVAALIKPEFHDTVKGRAYAFCDTPTCPVVYYTADGLQVLKTQLRVRVGAKETEDPIPVCYCFNVTERMIREEIKRTGRSTAASRIRAEVKAGNCRCEVENPSGRCCLGDVVAAEKRAARAVADLPSRRG